MACGYGVLGLAYLRLHPSAELTFCDESFQAISSTKYNLAHNIPKLQSESQVSIYADDGLKNMQAQSQELIICNPPFHQQHTVSTDILPIPYLAMHIELRTSGRTVDRLPTVISTIISLSKSVLATVQLWSATRSLSF